MINLMYLSHDITCSLLNFRCGKVVQEVVEEAVEEAVQEAVQEAVEEVVEEAEGRQ